MSNLKKNIYSWGICVVVFTILTTIVPDIIIDTPIDYQSTMGMIVLNIVIILGLTMAHTMSMFVAIGEYLCQEDQADDGSQPVEQVSC
jgi:carbon starvation protein CstA